MDNPQNEQILSPLDAANEVKISIHTVRRWCEWHAEYLSAGANPPPGAARHLSWQDIEVFKFVKELREQGWQTKTINKRLSEITFATVDTSETEVVSDGDTWPEEPPHALIDASSGNIVTTDIATTVFQRLESVEKSQQHLEKRLRDNVVMLGVGFIAASVFFLLMLLLFWATHR